MKRKPIPYNAYSELLEVEKHFIIARSCCWVHALQSVERKRGWLVVPQTGESNFQRHVSVFPFLAVWNTAQQQLGSLANRIFLASLLATASLKTTASPSQPIERWSTSQQEKPSTLERVLLSAKGQDQDEWSVEQRRRWSAKYQHYNLQQKEANAKLSSQWSWTE